MAISKGSIRSAASRGAADSFALRDFRRRIRGDRGQRLVRKRAELLGRPCAHLYETGGFRRVHARGHQNVLKRPLVHVSAFNPGLFMRAPFGIGTPRGLQGRLAGLGGVLSTRVTENATCTTRC